MSNALTIPDELIAPAWPIFVVLRHGGGWDFTWKHNPTPARLRVESITVGQDADLPRARLRLNTAPVRVEGEAGWVEALPGLATADYYNVLSADTELLILAETVDGARTFFFHGYPMVDQLKLQRDRETFEFVCTSKLEWVGRQRSSWILGRQFYDLEAAEVVDLESLPCVFNRDDKPNRHADLQEINEVEHVPVFTHDNDGNYWTYADVLRYLLAVYFKALPEDVTIDADQGLSLTEELVEANAGPQPLPDPNAAELNDILAEKAQPMACEGMSIVEALLLWCKMSGCALQQWTLNDDGDPVTKVLFHVHGDGGPWEDHAEQAERTERLLPSEPAPAPRALRLEKAGATAQGRNPLDFNTANEVFKANILRDADNLITTCRVLGGPELYEVEVSGAAAAANLLPAWAPDTLFGDDTAAGETLDAKVTDIKAAKDEGAEGNAATMFARYTRGGSSHVDYAAVGRLWYLNEDRALDGTDYGRSNAGLATYGATRYDTKFDWHTECNVPRLPDAAGLRTQDWSTRRRPILAPITKGPGGVRLRPILECSFDGGSNWYPYPGNYRILEDRFGVLLTDANLADILNKADDDADSTAGQSVWEAMVRGKFLLQMTCSVEGDAVVQGQSGKAHAVLTGEYHQDVHLHDALVAEFVTHANSSLPERTQYSGEDRDETDEADGLANRIVALGQDRRFSGTVILPRLTNRWRPGDRASGIDPRGVDFAVRNYVDRGPEVRRVTWVNTAENQTTHLLLGDSRARTRNV